MHQAVWQPAGGRRLNPIHNKLFNNFIKYFKINGILIIQTTLFLIVEMVIEKYKL